MPLEPLEFRIIQSLQTALKGISVAAGFHYDVEAVAVKLDPDHQVEDLIRDQDSDIPPPRPFIVLELPATEVFEYFPSEQLRLRLPFVVHEIHDSDPADDDSKLRTFHRLCADIEKAIAADSQRDNLATDTRVLSRRMRELEGQEVWAMVAGEIREHRTYGAPNG